MYISTIRLIQGDCLKKMYDIPDNSVDLVLADPPYGTTACKWDSVIPLDLMWNQLERVTKKSGAIILFCSQPFTSALIMSNIKMFKYAWVWDKRIPSGMSFAKYQPMRQTEDIAVFCAGKTTYNPQAVKRDKPIKGGGMTASDSAMTNGYKALKKIYEYKNPTTLISFDKIRNSSLHPTQKPVPLMEYLIKTYTNETETVLDFTMGSGTTGVACKGLNRNFIGIELDPEYFKIAEKRISESKQEGETMTVSNKAHQSTIIVNSHNSAYDVLIDRTTIFGNPFPEWKWGRERCIALFEEYFYKRINRDPAWKAEVLKLKGKILGCHCSPLPCHGAVYANYLNSYDEVENLRVIAALEGILERINYLATDDGWYEPELQGEARELVSKVDDLACRAISELANKDPDFVDGDEEDPDYIAAINKYLEMRKANV